MASLPFWNQAAVWKKTSDRTFALTGMFSTETGNSLRTDFKCSMMQVRLSFWSKRISSHGTPRNSWVPHGTPPSELSRP